MGARTACLCLSSILYPPSSRSTDAQQVLADCQCPTERGILTGCFTSFQLVSPGFIYQGKKSQTGRLKTYVFSYEERTRSRSLQTANAPPATPFHLRSGLRRFSAFPFHLVSPYDTLKHDKTRYF